MAKTTIETILDQLKSDMKKYIKTSNDYRTNPRTIYKGSFAPDEIKGYPVIGFDITGEDFEDYLGDQGMAYIDLDLYGYAYSDGVDRVDAIRNLAHDVLYFLHNNFTYGDDTVIQDALEYGGYKTLTFRLPIRIKYEWTNSNIR